MTTIYITFTVIVKVFDNFIYQIAAFFTRIYRTGIRNMDL